MTKINYGARQKRHSGKRNMRSECTVELSRSNFDAAVEAFLRSIDTIHDSETPSRMTYQISGKNDANVSITIHF